MLFQEKFLEVFSVFSVSDLKIASLGLLERPRANHDCDTETLR